MADISSLGNATHGNEQQATEMLRGQGISNPSSGLVRYVAYGAQDYGSSEAMQYGLPMSANNTNELFQNAIAPAVQSYEASKPEIAAQYDIRTNQLSAEKDPMMARYANLLADLTNREGKDTTTVAQNMSSEYGKRGISVASGIYQQDLGRQQMGITDAYGIQRKDVGLAEQADLRDLENSITNLQQERIATMRSIDNAIAGLKAGAGQGAVAAALDQYKTAQEQKFQSRFDALDTQIKQAQLTKANQPDYQLSTIGNNAYSFNPATNSLQLLKANAGGSSTTAAQTTTAAKQGVLDAAKSGQGLSAIISQYGSKLSVDDIVSLYAGVSPYGTPVEDWAKKILGVGQTSSIVLGQ